MHEYSMPYSLELLAAASGVDVIRPGDFVTFKPNFCVVTDAEPEFLDSYDAKKGVFDAGHILLAIDHQTPASTAAISAVHTKLIQFARENKIHFTQSGGVGYIVAMNDYVKEGSIVAACGKPASIMGSAKAVVVHCTPEEMGRLLSDGEIQMMVPSVVHITLVGQMSVGLDGKDVALHILRALGEGALDNCIVEFTGAISERDQRIICGMISEAGAISAMFVDAPSGSYVKNYEINISGFDSLVSLDNNIFQSKSAFAPSLFCAQAVFIGGCMSGQIEDLRIAAEILKGRHVLRGLRVFISAADRDTYIKAVDEGLVSIFIESGCAMLPAGCGGCHTKAYARVGAEENLVTAGGYCYKGCCGHPSSHVYITSVRTAAATALSGHVAAF